jgi:hypothetical protein
MCVRSTGRVRARARRTHRGLAVVSAEGGCGDLAHLLDERVARARQDADVTKLILAYRQSILDHHAVAEVRSDVARHRQPWDVEGRDLRLRPLARRERPHAIAVRPACVGGAVMDGMGWRLSASSR